MSVQSCNQKGTHWVAEIVLAAIAYFGTNILLKNEEVGDFLGGLKRRG